LARLVKIIILYNVKLVLTPSIKFDPFKKTKMQNVVNIILKLLIDKK
jgi:predicted membrane protein